MNGDRRWMIGDFSKGIKSKFWNISMWKENNRRAKLCFFYRNFATNKKLSQSFSDNGNFRFPFADPFPAAISTLLTFTNFQVVGMIFVKTQQELEHCRLLNSSNNPINGFHIPNMTSRYDSQSIRKKRKEKSWTHNRKTVRHNNTTEKVVFIFIWFANRNTPRRSSDGGERASVQIVGSNGGFRFFACSLLFSQALVFPTNVIT